MFEKETFTDRCRRRRKTHIQENTAYDDKRENTVYDDKRENTAYDDKRENTVYDDKRENTAYDDKRENTVYDDKRENTAYDDKRENTVYDDKRENTAYDDKRENTAYDDKRKIQRTRPYFLTFTSLCPPYVTLRRCHLHDYSTEVEQRSDPDSREVKRGDNRLTRWIMIDCAGGFIRCYGCTVQDKLGILEVRRNLNSILV